MVVVVGEGQPSLVVLRRKYISHYYIILGKRIRISTGTHAHKYIRMSHISRLFFLAVIILVLAFYFTSAFSESQFILPSQSHPKPSQAPFTRKIVAVGDLHGDLPNALKVLQMAHVVDAEGNWSGEIDIFVQTGDIIDR